MVNFPRQHCRLERGHFVALGPDLPAFFANDEDWAGEMLSEAKACNDPIADALLARSADLLTGRTS